MAKTRQDIVEEHSRDLSRVTRELQEERWDIHTRSNCPTLARVRTSLHSKLVPQPHTYLSARLPEMDHTYQYTHKPME